MPAPHGRLYWLLVAGAAVVGVVLLASLLVPLPRRGGDNAAERLRATQDSLVVARTETAEALTQMRERDQILGAANHSLDSILRTPPKVIYVRRPASRTP